MLRELADEDRTVLVSSHLLAEVQAIADHVVIISPGRLVRQGPIADVVGAVGWVRVRTPQPEVLTAALTSAGVINATTPLWTLLMGFLFGLDRSISWRKGAGFGLGFLGAVTIFSPWHSGNAIASWGGVVCLGAAASYGVSYVYMGRYLIGRGITPLMLAASQLVAATVILAVALPIGGRSHPVWRPDAILSLLVLGIIGTGLAYVLNYRIIEDEGAAIASTVTYLLPVVAIALGWIVLRESVGWATVAGVVLVLAGVALTRRRPTEDCH